MKNGKPDNNLSGEGGKEGEVSPHETEANYDRRKETAGTGLFSVTRIWLSERRLQNGWALQATRNCFIELKTFGGWDRRNQKRWENLYCAVLRSRRGDLKHDWATTRKTGWVSEKSGQRGMHEAQGEHIQKRKASTRILGREERHQVSRGEGAMGSERR